MLNTDTMPTLPTETVWVCVECHDIVPVGAPRGHGDWDAPCFGATTQVKIVNVDGKRYRLI